MLASYQRGLRHGLPIALGYLFAGANIAYQGVFQALGRGVPSMVLCLVRQLLAALPLAWLFTLLPNPEVWCWAAFPVAEGIGLLVALVQRKRILPDVLT